MLRLTVTVTVTVTVTEEFVVRPLQLVPWRITQSQPSAEPGDSGSRCDCWT